MTIITIIIIVIQDTISDFSPFDFLSAGHIDTASPKIALYVGIEEITGLA